MKNFKRENVLYKKGFTLIEVIAVIIIIGILAIVTVPAVSRYVSGARNKTYLAHEKSMKEAASSFMIECMDNNVPGCVIPDKGEKSLVYLNDLVDKGYLDRLKTADGGEFCSGNLSYVEIENTGKSNYEYNVCLYCGDYETENSSCLKYTSDGDNPVCGLVTGEKTSWTNGNRTIMVGCSDLTSGCMKGSFSKTFTTTTKEGTVEIVDKSGNVTECPVNVYVDKDVPTCELEVVGGVLESRGWYSGDVKVALKGYSDKGSGILTYGIGTSINNRDYNKKTELSGFNMGTTTVIGYVKDYAGNEGVCSIDIRVGAAKPTFDVEYGYQIYPEKESYTLSNMTENKTVLNSTSINPMISFTGLEDYKDVNRVVVYFNKGIPKTTEGVVFYSNGEYSEANSKKALMIEGERKVEFLIPKGTYKNIRIDFGNLSGLSYDIKKIELRVGDVSSLYTNKDVSVNVIGTNETARINEYSFDGGATWQSSSTKDYFTNTSATIMVKNVASLVSDSVNVNIGNIDKLDPSCTLKADGMMSSSEYFGTDVTVAFSNAVDKDGNIQYVKSDIRRYGIGSSSGSKSVIHTEENTTGVTYTGYVEDNAGNVGTCSITVKKKANFVVNYNNNGGTGCTTETLVFNNAIGSLCTPTRTGYTFAGWYKDSSLTNKVETTTIFTNDFTNLYAKWNVNNYTVTFNANGGSVSTASKTVIYDETYGTLPTPTRTGYTFTGWYTATSGGTQITSSTIVKITANQTLYARWKANCPSGGYTLQPNGTCVKTYAASTYYTCPSGGTPSGSTCITTSSYGATGSYSGGCSWSANSGYMSTRNNQSGCISKSSLPSCTASNNGATQKVHDCGSGKKGCKKGTNSYNCSYSTCSSTLLRYTYKLYTCSCSGDYTYSCPSGGTLSGSTCIITSSYNATVNYSCNSGDTLNGSTCTSVVMPS